MRATITATAQARRRMPASPVLSIDNNVEKTTVAGPSDVVNPGYNEAL